MTNKSTGGTMKNINHSAAALLSMIAAVFFTTSCIYEAPGDRFYRTLWTTSEEPFEGILIEFLCEEMISAQHPGRGIGSYGYYEHDGRIAYFTDLTATYNNFSVQFTEAYKSGDTLTVVWHLTNISEGSEGSIFLNDGSTPSPESNYSTTFVRLSSYP